MFSATQTRKTAELQRALAAGKPVLLDFWAPWCGPCRMLTPVMEQIEKEYAGKLQVLKINVDEETELARKFQIMSIPALLLIQNGSVTASSLGAKPQRAVEAWLSQNGVTK